MSSVDLAIKTRDAFQQLADVWNEYAENLGPKEDKPKAWTWDPFKISWDKRDGPKGPFEKCSEGKEDYSALIADLKGHALKLSKDGYFYWLFVDQISVGRKPQKTKQ